MEHRRHGAETHTLFAARRALAVDEPSSELKERQRKRPHRSLVIACRILLKGARLVISFTLPHVLEVCERERCAWKCDLGNDSRGGPCDGKGFEVTAQMGWVGGGGVQAMQ